MTNPFDTALMAALCERHFTYSEIGERLGISRGAAAGRARRMGLRTGNLPGRGHGCRHSDWLSPILYERAIRDHAARLGLSAVHVFSGAKDRRTVLARARAWQHLRGQLYSWEAMRRVSGYDHSTIISGVKRLPALEAWLSGKTRPHNPWPEPSRGYRRVCGAAA